MGAFFAGGEEGELANSVSCVVDYEKGGGVGVVDPSDKNLQVLEMEMEVSTSATPNFLYLFITFAG